MMQDSQKICRLCLMVVSQEIHFIDNIQKDILQITLPDMSIENCDELLMCRLCNELLQEFFKFKSTCLEIEDSIHNYTNEDQFQVDLEKIMGLRELEKDGKICRLCLDFIDGDIFLELSDENCLLVQMVQKCFPEMDLQLTKEPVLCEKCKNMLKKCFTFFSQCMENEYKISNYITTNGANILVLRKALQAISKTKIEFPIIDIMELTNRNTTTMRKISWEIDKTENTSNSDEITEIHLDNISSQKNSPKRNESITKENDIIHILSDHEDSFENSEIEISDDSDIDTSAKDPDYKPDCETEMSDSEKKNKKKLWKRIINNNNHPTFLCKYCNQNFITAGNLSLHIIPCKAFHDKNTKATGTATCRKLDERISNNEDPILYKSRHKVKEEDLLKGLRRIHKSIKKLGRNKKHKKKRKKQKRFVTKAKIIQQTDLSMKLKVLHSPKHIAEQRTELEVGNSTPVVESENNICIENDSEGTPSHLHLSDQSYDDDSLRRHNSLCDNNLDETLGLQEDLSELKETTVKVEDQFEIEIISGKIDEIEEQEIEYMQNRHRELTILKCDCCDFNTRSYRKIEQHILKHLYRLRGEENNVVLHCPYCPNKYRQVVQVYLHLKNVHLRCYYKIYHWCVNCAKIFLSVKAVQQHFLGCLDNKIVKLFKSNKTLFCMLCDFECDNSTEAKDHRKSCRFKELTVVGDTIEID